MDIASPPPFPLHLYSIPLHPPLRSILLLSGQVTGVWAARTSSGSAPYHTSQASGSGQALSIQRIFNAVKKNTEILHLYKKVIREYDMGDRAVFLLLMMMVTTSALAVEVGIRWANRRLSWWAGLGDPCSFSLPFRCHFGSLWRFKTRGSLCSKDQKSNRISPHTSGR